MVGFLVALIGALVAIFNPGDTEGFLSTVAVGITLLGMAICFLAAPIGVLFSIRSMRTRRKN
ncbi:MAG: hypothetical protein JWO05_1886 [Gemmatimonadetes bacterium]|nr:hypothetical protein [Gemmatimonadota bacterium]